MYSPLLQLLLVSLLSFLTSAAPGSTVVPHEYLTPTVHTNGVTFQGNLSHGVESFYNVKFGKNTGGEKRLSPPETFHYARNTIFNATIPGVACPQQRVPITGQSVLSNVTAYSEDCLTLRLDRPANTPSDAKLPVMVYIYGGGFTSGQIYDRAYNPTMRVLSAAEKGLPFIYVAVK